MKRYRRTRLTQSQRDPTDLLKQHLRPLLQGSTVKLAVDVTKKHGKQVRQLKYLALLAPATMYDAAPQAIVVSLIGKGSCIVFPMTGEGVSGLIQAGFPIRLATTLLEKLKELFGDSHHGTTKNTTSPPKPRPRRPRSSG